MDGLLDLIKNNTDVMTTVGNAIIGLAAVVFIAILLVKAIKEFSGQKVQNGIKYIGYALLVVIVAALGIIGVQTLGNAIAPTSEIIPGMGG